MDSHSYYRSLAAQYPPLSLEEETVLIERIAAGGPGVEPSVRSLVLHNVGYVIACVIERVRPASREFNDALGAAMDGLNWVAWRVKPCGVRFFSFARPRIDGAISDYLQSANIVMVTRYGFHAAKHANSGARAQTEAAARAAMAPVVEMDAPIDHDVGGDADGSSTIHSTLADPLATHPAEAIESAEIISQAEEILTPRHMEIIRARFGLDGADIKSYREIGLEMKISGERVRQLEEEAIKRLRGNVGLLVA